MSDDLERRMAALRASRTPSVPSTDDELAARFQKLFSRPPTARDASSALPAQAPTPHNPEDDLAVQELLDSVYDQKDTWTLAEDDERGIAELLGAARGLCAAQAQPPAHASAPEGRPDSSADVPEWLREDTPREVESDAGEEDEILRQVRDELALEEMARKLGASNAPATEAGNEAGSSASPAAEPDDGLSELEARFRSLSPLELPAVPQTDPKVARAAAVAKAAPRDVDETETWCCICNEDAEYRCSGCENDIYCKDCLYEAHIGPDAGLEERRHKWTKYVRPKKVVPA